MGRGKNDDNTNLSEVLRAFRLKNGFTQQYIADALGICRAAYTYYETGKTQPGVQILHKLAVFYHIAVSELIGRNRKESVGDMKWNLNEINPAGIGQLSDMEKEFIAQLRESGK